MSMEALDGTVPQPGLWSSVREALRGSHQDYTTGNLNRAILLLAIPMVLEMVLESLFAVVDVLWVGRLGANAVATVGLTESLLVSGLCDGIGLSMSTTAMVARRIGEKDPEDAAVPALKPSFSDCSSLWQLEFHRSSSRPSFFASWARRQKLSPPARGTRGLRLADAALSSCSFSTTPSSAAPAMRPSPCVFFGYPTSST